MESSNTPAYAESNSKNIMAITALSTASAIAAKSISLSRTVIMAQTMAATTKMTLAGLTGTNFASKEIDLKGRFVCVYHNT